MDYLLRTNTESQMDDALEAAGIVVEQDMGEGELALLPIAGAYLDRIGPIPAQLDPEGEIIRPGDSRYHANLRVTFDLTAAQVAMLPLVDPAPTVPYRVFG